MLSLSFCATYDSRESTISKISVPTKYLPTRVSSREITQQAHEALSSVRQPVIARLEGNVSDPRLTTILKILRPLGKTFAIVPIEKEYCLCA